MGTTAKSASIAKDRRDCQIDRSATNPGNLWQSWQFWQFFSASKLLPHNS
jgi:hypothetical protein